VLFAGHSRLSRFSPSVFYCFFRGEQAQRREGVEANSKSGEVPIECALLKSAPKSSKKNGLKSRWVGVSNAKKRMPESTWLSLAS